MPDLKPKYEVGEKLLCFHGPLMYEAKCLDVKVKEDGVMYFVHYQGWNKNWDEWVTDKRMFKYNEEGLKKQEELERQIRLGKKMKVLRKSDLKTQSLPPPEVLKDVERALKPVETIKEEESVKSKQKVVEEVPEEMTDVSCGVEIKDNESVKSTTTNAEESLTITPSPAPVSSRRRKGRLIAGVSSFENDGGFLSKPQLVVQIPSSLKAWLVDDWDLITRQARLYELPASQPVSTLISNFLEYAEAEIKQEPVDNDSNTTTDSHGSQPSLSLITPRITSDLRREFVAGIQHYFNLIIGSQLLYKFERLQYAELLKHHTDKKMSDIYGPMHLLRLFVKLRDMVSFTRVDVNSLPILEKLVAEFLQYLHQNQSRYFRLEDYTVATAEYQRRAMC